MKEEPRRLQAPARVTGVIASLVMILVMIGTVLIVAPDGTPGRGAARSVGLPYFGQTWRVFAPNILQVDRTLEMRAQWRDDSGELVKSDWISITGIEQTGVSGNAVPSNIRKSSWNASGSYLQRYNALDDEQRTRVRDTFIEPHDGGFRAIPVEDLIADLGENDGDVIRFLRMDYMLMRYSTMYATAGFGTDIERVQWRVVRERKNDFTHRFDEEQQFDTAVTTFGWRQTTVAIEPDIIDEYRSVIERFGAEQEFEEAARVAE